ncbi:MAG TPA: Trp biosynthesis-associated membrane protein [Jatrophihabitans sp.]|jgi:uncharacterized membrane protein (TIGR02234 family)
MKAFGAALGAQIIGAAALLLIATRDWQTVTTVRPRPFGTDVLELTGRTVDGAITALALVALAGVVAVIATKSTVRRVVGALVALAGAALVWRTSMAFAAVSDARARALVSAKHPQVVGPPQITTHPVWPALSLVAAVLVVAAGAAIALRGGHWAGMSSRYERQSVDPEQAKARADASLWAALESGDDPTARDPRDAH